MKQKKYIILFLILIVILSSIVLPVHEGRKNEIASINKNTICNCEKYADVKLLLKNCENKNQVEFILPKENTVQDYNTYYGNMILYELNSNCCSKLEKSVDEIVANKSFMKRGEYDVFEGIEKCYYYDYLCRTLNSNYYNENIKKYTKDLMDKTFNKDGYFLSKEFENYITTMSEEERVTTLLSQTMEMLYLCYQYDFIDDINIPCLTDWLNGVSGKTNKIVDWYYIYEICKFLKKDYAGIKKKIENYELNMEEINYIELFSYVYLCDSEKIKVLNKTFIEETIQREIQEVTPSNLQEMFYIVKIAKLLDVGSLSGRFNELSNLLMIYRYENDLFPQIGNYVLDNKQLLMYIEMNQHLGTPINISKYKDLVQCDFENCDSMYIPTR